jgi:hypothetical protein
MKIALSVVFALFAIVQYNDPDWYLWIPLYLVIVAALLMKQIYANKNVLLVLTIIYALYAASYIPYIVEWVQSGFTSIVGEMKASTPVIEWTREFFGLLLCIATLFWLLKKQKSIATS